jgi:ketosteroid isomerase-like protein
MMRRTATNPRGTDLVHAIMPAALGIAIALLLVGCSGASSGASDDPATTPQGEEPALVDPAAATEASEAAMIDAWFAKDLDAVMAIFAEDAIFEDKTFGDYLEGAPAVRDMYASAMKFTDAEASELLDHFVASDCSRAVVVYRWIGTNYLGRAFDLPFVGIHEYRDGKIIKATLYYAAADTYDQLTTPPSAE